MMSNRISSDTVYQLEKYIMLKLKINLWWLKEVNTEKKHIFNVFVILHQGRLSWQPPKMKKLLRFIYLHTHNKKNSMI